MKYNKIFDFLSVIHFLIYYVFGLFVKNNYTLAFILGILWELFEIVITTCDCTRKLLIKYWIVPKRIWDEDVFNINRVSDMVFNLLGYHFGNISKKKYNLKI